jgi:hypothetical protein
MGITHELHMIDAGGLQDVAYHNLTHSADVVQTLNALYRWLDFWQETERISSIHFVL